MRIGVAMGSNLGDRGNWIAAARDRLLMVAGPQPDYRQAPLFASDPVDCPPGSPEFLNTAVELDVTGMDVLEFLRHCQEIERSFGRPLPKDRHRNAPRPVDIDLLYLADGTTDHPELVLPHPRMSGRRFVLQPLACIVPERIPGGMRQTIAEMLLALRDDVSALRLVATEW